MNKELKKLLIIISISIFICVVLAACKSKKVKDNGDTTVKEFVYSPIEYDVPDELKVKIYGVGKNIVRVDLSKPEIEKIYEERKSFEYERTAGIEISDSYRYQMEVYLKKGEDVKFTIKANKFGIVISSTDKMGDGEYINQKIGGISGEWIFKKKIMEIQMIYPGIVEKVKECDNYEVYFVDKESDLREAIYGEDNIISQPFQTRGRSYKEKMSFDLECKDENTAYVKMHCFKFSGSEYEKVLVTLGEEEDRYMMLHMIDSYSEIETIDVLLNDEDYNNNEINIGGIEWPIYKVELGEIIYGENGEREFVPMLSESGNVFNAPVGGSYNLLIKREGIKAFFDDCNIYRGYVGDDFEELVYVVTK